MHTYIQESDGTFAVIDPTGRVVLDKMNISGAKALCESLNKKLPPKTNEDYLKEFIENYYSDGEEGGIVFSTGFNEQLIENWLRNLLKERDKQKEEAVAEARRDCLEVFEDLTTWYNTNNHIPDSELGKSEEHWDMLRKIVKDSLKEVFERAKKYLTPLDTVNAIRNTDSDEEAVIILRKNTLRVIELLHQEAMKTKSIEALNAIEEIQKELFRL